jgi:hypothetical protein
VSHASSGVWPPVLTSSPPRPTYATYVAPQDTWDHSSASPLPNAKPVAHVLTQKTCVANQNKIGPKAAQEDSSDSSTSGMSRDDLASIPTYCCQTHTNSTLS